MSTPETEDAPTSESSSVFADHVVLYLDFLGVSAAATSWPDDRAEKLIGALRIVADARSRFDLDGASQSDGSFKFDVTAETSTFSDHIVASYLIYPGQQNLLNIVMGMYVSLARDMISKVAMLGLDVGLLVRGGLTIGKLYHYDGVVFGEAMIDAHLLESKVAVFPRIAVSPRIYESLSEADQRKLLRQDSDGVWHLGYISNMLENVPEANRQRWVDSIIRMIDENIQAFEKAGKAKELSKWNWFKTEFLAVS